MVRIRKNVLTLDARDDTLLWYGKAIAAMQKKLVADPSSWRYQAAIHDYTPGQDPNASTADKLPSKADQKKFWMQCQHGSWYFLPWHRMYLHHFEQIVLAELKKQGGPDTWALPYWNYSASATAALLPAAFRNSSLPDGSPNPLFVAQRDANANAGRAIASAIDTDIKYCLNRTLFPGGNTGGSAGFGGPVTKFEHGGSITGSTETVPHGTMHVAVGGPTGWMSAFNTAPLDPIFWLHHCNIDRLWEVWIQRDPAHANPQTSNWLKSVSFPFHDAAGKVVAMTPSQVLNTQAMPLQYAYDDTSDPLKPAAPVSAMAAAGSGKGAKTGKGKSMAVKGTTGRSMPEMVGATATSFTLQKDVVEQPITLQKPTGPAMVNAAAVPRRVFLHIEAITSDQRSVPYDVYLNLPPGADPVHHPELRAGRLPMFGLVEASQSGRKHPKNGLHYTIEITELYQRLAAEPDWKPRNLRVSLVPTRTDGPAGAKVGRLSVYFE
ncbi:MAG TPA: tyrosinase family protein [Tepidisphaeraceae bacterium]|jgi:tyrosinase|nr:tyrosinase family protein [Tepidisphaeraceae bacterium]